MSVKFVYIYYVHSTKEPTSRFLVSLVFLCVGDLLNKAHEHKKTLIKLIGLVCLSRPLNVEIKLRSNDRRQGLQAGHYSSVQEEGCTPSTVTGFPPSALCCTQDTTSAHAGNPPRSSLENTRTPSTVTSNDPRYMTTHAPSDVVLVTCRTACPAATSATMAATSSWSGKAIVLSLEWM